MDVYIIFEDWFTPYAKKQYNYDHNTTLMMDLKRDIGEEFGILPTKLMGAVSHPTNISAYLFHDEDKISKVIIFNNTIGSKGLSQFIFMSLWITYRIA